MFYMPCVRVPSIVTPSSSPSFLYFSDSPRKRGKPSGSITRNQRCTHSEANRVLRDDIYSVDSWSSCTQNYHAVSPVVTAKSGLSELSSFQRGGDDDFFSRDLDASDLGMLDFLDDDIDLLNAW